MPNRRMTHRIVALLVCVCIMSGMSLPAAAQSVRRDAGTIAIVTRTTAPATAMTPRRARLLLRQRLEASNRLALEIASLKLALRGQAGLVRDALQQLRKRSDRLTGDQLSVLKELTQSVRTHREEVVAKELVVGDARLRMRQARIDGRLTDAVAAAEELIAAQTSLLRLMQDSKAAADRLTEIAAQTLR